ncbi:DUF3899 domain-containing protein [Bacillota bacterium Lsc_1132]
MSQNQKGRLAVFAVIQFAIIVSSLLFYHKLTLLYYINISFYYSFGLLISSLFLFVVRSGFFDVIAKSFTIAFSKHDEKRKFKEITPLSELVSIKQKPLIFHGLATGILMLIALTFYYA